MKRAPERKPSSAARFPPWIRRRIPSGGRGAAVRAVLAELGVATVCSSAHCPNLGECFAEGTATFMILGKTCTRDCAFCAVRHGPPGPPQADEPERVAEAARRMGLRYVVITSVTRDDLPDGGADHFRLTVEAVRRRTGARVEVLTPDFGGRTECLDVVCSAGPTVFNHNVETVPRLYPAVRPGADYARSLAVLEHVHRRHRGVRTKSGLMVGLGETAEEVYEVMRDLGRAGCEFLTVGQYLRPSPHHAPVARFVTPEEFVTYERVASDLGFAAAAGPFVRSSYRAGELLSRAERDGAGDTR